MLLLFGFSAVASSQVVTLDTRNVTLNEALKQLKTRPASACSTMWKNGTGGLRGVPF